MDCPAGSSWNGLRFALSHPACLRTRAGLVRPWRCSTSALRQRHRGDAPRHLPHRLERAVGHVDALHTVPRAMYVEIPMARRHEPLWEVRWTPARLCLRRRATEAGAQGPRQIQNLKGPLGELWTAARSLLRARIRSEKLHGVSYSSRHGTRRRKRVQQSPSDAGLPI